MSSKESRKTNGRGRLYGSVVETIGDTPSISGLSERMTDAELALMRSTPGYHMPSA